MAEEKLKALPMVTSSSGSSAAAAVVPDAVSAAVPAYPVTVVVEEKLRLANFKSFTIILHFDNNNSLA
jgi:cyanophycinase-like exopeptidase